MKELIDFEIEELETLVSDGLTVLFDKDPIGALQHAWLCYSGLHVKSFGQPIGNPNDIEHKVY